MQGETHGDTEDETFLTGNLKAIDAFPRAMMLPGFWSEYGICTEPSAFGARLVWGQDDFPSPGKLLQAPRISTTWKGPTRASTA